jgi:hypothetical protein
VAPLSADKRRKTVLIVGADFTPSSYPPALRIRFFAQHLREFGWEPIVLTTDPKFYEWSVDPENEKLLPSDLEVIRTRAFPARWTRKIGIGDLGIRSLWHHWRELSHICRKRKVDLIYIPVPPNWTMMLGRLAHTRFGIPYILDYIDPVVSRYYWTVPHSQRPPKWPLVYAMYKVLEPFSLRRVSELVSVDTSYLSGIYDAYPWIANVNATGLAFGAEPGDFEYVRCHPRKNAIFDKNDGLIHLSYVGRGGVDMIPALRAVFSATREGLQRDPELFKRLRIHFVGTTYAVNAERSFQVLPTAHEVGVEQLVDEHPGRIHHLDAIQVLLDSHALLLVGSTLPHYTASKVFPYVMAQKQLLAVFNEESSGVQLIREMEAGTVVTFGSSESPENKVQEILEEICKLLELPAGFRPPTRWESFEPYTARAVTSRLARVLDRVIGDQMSTFGTQQVHGGLT